MRNLCAKDPTSKKMQRTPVGKLGDCLELKRDDTNIVSTQSLQWLLPSYTDQQTVEKLGGSVQLHGLCSVFHGMVSQSVRGLRQRPKTQPG